MCARWVVVSVTYFCDACKTFHLQGLWSWRKDLGEVWQRARGEGGRCSYASDVSVLSTCSSAVGGGSRVATRLTGGCGSGGGRWSVRIRPRSERAEQGRRSDKGWRERFGEGRRGGSVDEKSVGGSGSICRGGDERARAAVQFRD